MDFLISSQLVLFIVGMFQMLQIVLLLTKFDPTVFLLCRFSCNAGYALVGDQTRTCRDDNDGDAQGFWTNTRPTCQRK